MILTTRFSPDSKTLVAIVAKNRKASLLVAWDLANQSLRWISPGPEEFGFALEFAPDGTWIVAGGWDGSVCALDTATGKQRWRLALGTSVHAVAVAAGGATVAIAADEHPVLRVDGVSGAPQWRSDEALKSPSRRPLFFAGDHLVGADKMDLFAWSTGKAPRRVCHHPRLFGSNDEVWRTSDPRFLVVSKRGKSEVVYSRLAWEEKQRQPLHRVNVETLRASNPPKVGRGGGQVLHAPLEAYIECKGVPFIALQMGKRLHLFAPGTETPSAELPGLTTSGDQQLIGAPGSSLLGLVRDQRVILYTPETGKKVGLLEVPKDIGAKPAAPRVPSRLERIHKQIQGASKAFRSVRERVLAGFVGLEQEHELPKNAVLFQVGPVKAYFYLYGPDGDDQVITAPKLRQWGLPLEALAFVAGMNSSDSVTWPKKPRTGVAWDDEGRGLVALVCAAPFIEHNQVEGGERLLVVFDANVSFLGSSRNRAELERVVAAHGKRTQHQPLTPVPLQFDADTGWREADPSRQ